jgi:hypothetical protein
MYLKKREREREEKKPPGNPKKEAHKLKKLRLSILITWSHKVMTGRVFSIKDDKIKECHVFMHTTALDLLISYKIW